MPINRSSSIYKGVVQLCDLVGYSFCSTVGNFPRFQAVNHVVLKPVSVVGDAISFERWYNDICGDLAPSYPRPLNLEWF